MTKKKAVKTTRFVVEDYTPEADRCQMDNLFGAVDCAELQTKKVWIGEASYYLLCQDCADDLTALVYDLGLDG